MRQAQLRKVFLSTLLAIICCGIIIFTDNNIQPVFAADDHCSHSGSSPTSRVVKVNWHFSGFMPDPYAVSKNCPLAGDFDYKTGGVYNVNGKTVTITGWRDQRQNVIVNADTRFTELDLFTLNFDFVAVTREVEDEGQEGDSEEDGGEEGSSGDGGDSNNKEEEEEKHEVVPGSNSLTTPDACEKKDVMGWIACSSAEAVTGIIDAIISNLLLPMLQWRILI